MAFVTIWIRWFSAGKRVFGAWDARSALLYWAASTFWGAVDWSFVVGAFGNSTWDVDGSDVAWSIAGVGPVEFIAVSVYFASLGGGSYSEGFSVGEITDLKGGAGDGAVVVNTVNVAGILEAFVISVEPRFKMNLVAGFMRADVTWAALWCTGFFIVKTKSAGALFVIFPTLVSWATGFVGGKLILKNEAFTFAFWGKWFNDENWASARISRLYEFFAVFDSWDDQWSAWKTVASSTESAVASINFWTDVGDAWVMAFITFDRVECWAVVTLHSWGAASSPTVGIFHFVNGHVVFASWFFGGSGECACWAFTFDFWESLCASSGSAIALEGVSFEGSFKFTTWSPVELAAAQWTTRTRKGAAIFWWANVPYWANWR